MWIEALSRFARIPILLICCLIVSSAGSDRPLAQARTAEENRQPAGEREPAPENLSPNPFREYLRAVKALEEGDYDSAAQILLPLSDLDCHLVPAAQYELGLAFKTGKGAPRDPARSREMFRRAADGGHGIAQYELGRALLNSSSPSERIAAHGWLGLAVLHGEDAAAEEQERLIAVFSSEQLEDSRHWTKGWIDARLEALEGRTLISGSNGVSNPTVIKSSLVQPAYPKGATPRKTEANVILNVIVRADGTVGDAEVYRCDPPDLGFEEAALTAVRQWRYRPATYLGREFDVFFRVYVDFRLR